MNLQQAIHWLEQGGGTRVFKVGALLLTLLGLSATVAYKQFHGPRSEETLRQADLGRSIANGQGFTTSVNYPQVHATLENRGHLYDATERMPEVYHAPAYPLVIAATLAVLPEGLRNRLFTEIPDPPAGFGADYLLLGLNGLFLAVAAWQCWLLGRRLFDARVGLVAAVCVLVSSSIWSHVVAVDGTSLAMVLLLGLFQVLVGVDERLTDGKSPWGGWVLAGILSGLLFLTDYPLGVLFLVVAVHAVWRKRAPAVGVVLVVALLVALPWMIRNVSVNGSPVAMAGQDIALRVNDSTAEPETFRTTMSAEGPRLSLNKMGNKVLTALLIGSAGWEVAFGPTAQNLSAGDYPLALTLSLVFERARAQELLPWLKFCYSDEVSRALEQANVVPLPRTQRNQLVFDLEVLETSP